MPGRRKNTLDIRELVLQLRKHASDRAVARNNGTHWPNITGTVTSDY